MIEIDGSDAGGQLVRTAISLSMLAGESIELTGIRGGRSTPGLRPQHVTAIETAAGICDATVEGNAEGSDELVFEPAGVHATTLSADIGTAGSMTLLFDTLLPLAVTLDGPLTVHARGGTDVKWSPTMAYYRRVKLPLLRQFGLQATVERDRSGFYPAGDGRATLRVAPSQMASIRLLDRGSSRGARIYSTASLDLADSDVAERQALSAAQRLEAETGISVCERTVTYANTASTGSALTLRIDYDDTVAGFDALGERGKPAEDVAADAVEAGTTFEESTAAVDSYMADQLLVFLALVGGQIRTRERTDHLDTSIDLLSQFGYDVTAEQRGDSVVVTGQQ